HPPPAPHPGRTEPGRDPEHPRRTCRPESGRGGVVTLNQEQFEETVRAVAAEVTRRLETGAEGDSTPDQERSHARRLARTVLDERAGRALSQGHGVLDADTEQAIQRRVVARVCGLGPLEELLQDPEI